MWIVLLALLSFGCARKVAPQPPPPIVVESFCDFLVRTEYLTCSDLTSHQEGESPDPKKAYDALVRGRNAVAVLFPNVASIKFGRFTFFRSERFYDPNRPYPLIVGWRDFNTSTDVLVRGIFHPDLLFIITSYENVLQHEIAHALVYLAEETLILREAKFITDAYPQKYLYEVMCHGSEDDPFGEPGNVSSCIAPFKLD